MPIPSKINLGRLAEFNRFFVYKLTEWTGAKYKLKHPWDGGRVVSPDDACATYEEAAYLLEQCQLVARPGTAYALGWHIRADAAVWFLDIDSCVAWPNGPAEPPVITDEGVRAWQFATASGAMVEYSSSMQGLHVIGSGVLPAHGNRKANGTFELYSSDRGICFGMSGAAWGSVSAVAPVPSEWMLPATKEYLVSDAGGFDTPVPEWDGPEDDAQLLALMRKRRDTHKLLEGGCTVAELLDGDRSAIARAWPDAADKDDGLCSDADAALASHLAFYTGKDLPRMMELLKDSGLYREKFERDDYLKRTCLFACRNTTRVFKRAPVLPALPVVAGAAVVARDVDIHRGLEAARRAINAAGNADELKAACVQVAGIQKWDLADRETIAQTIKARSAILQTPWSLAVCRSLVNEPVIVEASAMPDWAKSWVYLTSKGQYCNVDEGYYTIPQANIHATLARKLEGAFHKGNGSGPMDVHKLMAETWNVPQAVDVGWHPKEGLFFNRDKAVYVNKFIGSMPDPEPFDQAHIDVIREHLWLVCNHEEQTYWHLLRWLAWQSQRPGELVRWAVMFVSVTGTGKSTLSRIMGKALGNGNVKRISKTDVANSGGFLDYAMPDKILGVFEDFSITGYDKFEKYETIKPILTDDRIGLTRKGAVGGQFDNFSNYFANTNRSDALPLDPQHKERRWLIIHMQMLNRLVHEGKSDEYFERLNAAIDACPPGALRGWLNSVDIPDTWPPSRAPETKFLLAMSAASESEVAAEIREYCDSFPVVPARMVTQHMQRLKLANQIGAEPKTSQIKGVMLNLGYQAYSKRVKFLGLGGATTVYVKDDFTDVDSVTLHAKVAEFRELHPATLLAP